MYLLWIEHLWMRDLTLMHSWFAHTEIQTSTLIWSHVSVCQYYSGNSICLFESCFDVFRVEVWMIKTTNLFCWRGLRPMRKRDGARRWNSRDRTLFQDDIKVFCLFHPKSPIPFPLPSQLSGVAKPMWTRFPLTRLIFTHYVDCSYLQVSFIFCIKKTQNSRRVWTRKFSPRLTLIVGSKLSTFFLFAQCIWLFAMTIRSKPTK